MKAKFTTNIDKKLLEKTKIKAIQEGKNVNGIIENLLEEYLKGEKEMTNYGTVTYEGKEYILTQQAYIMGVGIEEWSNEEVYYLANAIDSEGNEYEVEWELNKDTREAYNEIERQRELGEAPNYSLVEDESTACDWDAPVDVREI